MIISASYKTDIPAFYGAWFEQRLAAGSCRVVNPYGGKSFVVSLTPENVDGYVFWTRNGKPFLHVLENLAGRVIPFIVQFTATGYPRPLDAATIESDLAIEQIKEISRRFGVRVPVWRYDPIVLTDLTPVGWHIDNFQALARRLNGRIDEVVVSFVHVYRKTRLNLDRAAAAAGFVWHDPPADDKRALLAQLREIAADHNMKLSLCGQPELLSDGGRAAKCIDAARLSDIAGHDIAGRDKAHRRTCDCHASRDIGDYESCPHGCVYCYAVRRRATAKQRHQRHDPSGPFLNSPENPSIAEQAPTACG